MSFPMKQGPTAKSTGMSMPGPAKKANPFAKKGKKKSKKSKFKAMAKKMSMPMGAGPSY